MDGQVSMHENGYQLGLKHGEERAREMFDGLVPKNGEAFLDSSLRYVTELRNKIIEIQSAPQAGVRRSRSDRRKELRPKDPAHRPRSVCDDGPNDRHRKGGAVNARRSGIGCAAV